MRNLIVAAIVSLFVASTAFAATCEEQAVDKNGKALKGAAKASSIKKCEKDAKGSAPSCESKAVDKNGKPLKGAAKTSSIKKCEKDAK